jgi:stage II sporulation protein D
MQRRVLLLTVTAAVALSASAWTAPALARSAKKGSATFVVTGRGFGHGVGMGAYGMYGYAKHGWRYQKILGHYYKHTSIGKMSIPQVRVLLVDGVSQLTVSSSAGFRVRDANDVSYKLAKGAYTFGPKLKIKVDPAKPAKALPGPIMFSPGHAPLTLYKPYRGSLQVSSKSGRLRAINYVRLNDYVQGVVPEEISSDWPTEALKAQAVASRTYAVAVHKSGAYDVYADTRSQVYGGVDAETFATNAAVDATARQVVEYHGHAIVAYFSASSGGRTAAIQDAWPGTKPVPYLRSVKDPWDILSPYHHWGPIPYTAGSFGKQLGLSGPVLDAKIKRNPSMRVTALKVTTRSGKRSFPGDDVRSLLGLRSTWFSVGVLELDLPAHPLRYQMRSRLTGVDRKVKGVWLQGRKNGVWKKLSKVKPDSTGRFVVHVRAKATRRYRLSNGKVSTAPVRIQVAPAVHLDPATSLSYLAGRVRPTLTGEDVFVQRKENGVWTQVAGTTVASDGTFKARFTVTPGLYRAKTAAGGGFAAGTSPTLKVVASGPRMRYLAFDVNDPLAAHQWYLQQIQAFDHWPAFPALDPGPRIAVIDSGVDGGHPEFHGRIEAAKSFVGGSPRSDKVGHGTFVAGEIAAGTDNGVGIAGIAFPAQLLIAKVVRGDGSIPIAAEVQAIHWAVRKGARIINLSISGLRDPRHPSEDTYSAKEAAAVRYAVRHHVLVVAAVGNSDATPSSPWNYAGYPAALPHVLGVSALNRSGNVPGFSNRDRVYNDLSAPGAGIFSTFPRALTAPDPDCVDQGYSDCGPADWRSPNGTSFSAPMVTAAAGLVLALRPSLRPDQVTWGLTHSAVDVKKGTGCPFCTPGHDRFSGWGRVDVDTALTQALGRVPRHDTREPNDDAGAQAAVVGGRTGKLRAAIDAWNDPLDVYRVRLVRGQRLSLLLRGGKGVHCRLALWRPGTRHLGNPAQRIVQTAKAGTVEAIRGFRARATGWYDVEVKAGARSSGPYSLRVRKG